jgi:hypothetical protein
MGVSGKGPETQPSVLSYDEHYSLLPAVRPHVQYERQAKVRMRVGTLPPFDRKVCDVRHAPVLFVSCRLK